MGEKECRIRTGDGRQTAVNSIRVHVISPTLYCSNVSITWKIPIVYISSHLIISSLQVSLLTPPGVSLLVALSLLTPPRVSLLTPPGVSLLTPPGVSLLVSLTSLLWLLLALPPASPTIGAPIFQGGVLLFHSPSFGGGAFCAYPRALCAPRRRCYLVVLLVSLRFSLRRWSSTVYSSSRRRCICALREAGGQGRHVLRLAWISY